MKNKLIILIMLLILLSCCHVKNYNYMVVFQGSFNGMYGPDYLTLRMNSKIYEYYTPFLEKGSVGFFEIKSDTITLFPKYRFDEKLNYHPIITTDSIFTKYVKRKNKLIEITDFYNFYYQIYGRVPQPEELPKPNVFTLIK
ncbi:MAG: hypothetical protein LBC68_10175 [Prevotellaceae bacterium]|nr:hypothetical protein [Prevotellaceae bacterium]